MCIIGLDIHCGFGEAVAWENGDLKRLGRVDMRRDLLEAFAAKLSPDDIVVIEATGNAMSAAAVIAPHVEKVRPCAGTSSATLEILHIVRRVALSQANMWSNLCRYDPAS